MELLIYFVYYTYMYILYIYTYFHISKKHHSIKFDFKFSKEKIEVLDTLVYKDHNNRLQTTLYKKPTDCQNYLHAKPAHPFSLKKSISLQSSTKNKTCLLNFR